MSSVLEWKIQKMKRKEKEDALSLIPIYLDDDLVGFLRPITYEYTSELPFLVQNLSMWRKNSTTAATGTFEVTDERTEKWLQNLVLDNSKRILFVVMNLNNDMIGQIGFGDIDVKNNQADIDAVLRGTNEIPGIMGAALKSLIRWGKEYLKFQSIFLDCFNDNVHALKFYEKHGFKEVDRIALVLEHYPGEDKWEICREMEPKLAERCYIRMKLEEE